MKRIYYFPDLFDPTVLGEHASEQLLPACRQSQAQATADRTIFKSIRDHTTPQASMALATLQRQNPPA